jgi:hypothetical protein
MDIELSIVHDSSVLQQNLLGYNFSSALKSEILKFLFGSLGCNLTAADFDKDPKLWKGYFKFYSDQCIAVLNDTTHTCPVKSHQDFLKVVRLLQNPRTTRESIKENLRKKLPKPELSGNEKILNDTINLAARIGSMTFVGRFYFDIAWQRKVSWQDGSLEALLDREFLVPQSLEDDVKLEKLFTARNLNRVGGIKIKWTNNLADHLLMHDDDATVAIFHHASFLKLHQERYVDLMMLAISIPKAC